MRTIEQRFTVSYAYPVVFLRDLFAPDCEVLAELLARETSAPTPRRVWVILDRGVELNHPDLPLRITQWLIAHASTIQPIAPIEVFSGGEFVKRQGNIDRIVKKAYQAHMGRKDFFIAIGGGALQDAVGYAAGTIHRGCHVIRINTTTLSQADAGVGVKNGIDYASYKNFLGTFAPPFAVINDASFLTTLSDKDWRNGIAEAVKVAVIKDYTFFQWLEEHADLLRGRDLDTMAELIERTAALHLAHIAGAGDPFEKGAARPLDFGHWSAHCLESMTSYEMSHGEAVAIGIALDMVYAALQDFVTPPECTRVVALLRNCGLPIWSDELALRGGDGRLAILKGLQQFREHLGGQLCITLPTGLGSKQEIHEMDEALLERSVTMLRDRYA